MAEERDTSSRYVSANNVDSTMEFDTLNECGSNDNDLQEMNSDDSEVSADETDRILDESLGDYGKQNQHEEGQKVILKSRGRDPFEVLPLGWIEVTHNSGMPVYLHLKSRICCVSKPYFLGPDSIRKHEIPVSAIPCLHYLKQLEKEKENAKCVNEGNNTSENKCPANTINVSKDKDNVSENKSEVPENSIHANFLTRKTSQNETIISEDKNDVIQINNTSNTSKDANFIFPSAKLESVKNNKVSDSLDYLAVREYCQKRFEFQTITVKPFKTWYERKKHEKRMKRKQCLPDSAVLITCPVDLSAAVGDASKEFILNTIGKSPVCILHEYVQHFFKVQPKYVFKQHGLTAMPYSAVLLINDMEYGCGYGTSKKNAKFDAAKNALEILIPKIKTFTPKRKRDDDDFQDVEFFDRVRVEDPRIPELSVKLNQLLPFQVLLDCLIRNYGDTAVNIEMNYLTHWKNQFIIKVGTEHLIHVENEFLMKVGKYTATVICKNKRDGKHRAAQAILQQLYPHITFWGSLLEMYGRGYYAAAKKKKV